MSGTVYRHGSFCNLHFATGIFLLPIQPHNDIAGVGASEKEKSVGEFSW